MDGYPERMPEQIGGPRGRLALLRKLRGLTQQQLADRAHISVSYLRKVEQGSKPVSSGLVSAMARALNVEREKLTGQPYRSGDRRQDAVFDLVPDVRRELIAYRLPPDDLTDVPAPPVEVLVRATAEATRYRHKGDLLKLGVRLPGLLGDLRRGTFLYEGAQREQVMALLAETYWTARQWLRKLGFGDLSILLTNRYEWAAVASNDPLAAAMADVFWAGDLDGAADWAGARTMMDRAISRFDTRRDDPPALSVYGWLHLNAAYVAAHAGRADDAWSHHRAAEEAAERVGTDTDHYRIQFGPTNVGIWSVALAVEMMDGPTAVTHARELRLPPRYPAERTSHHYIDLARGYQYAGDTRASLAALQQARRVSPQQTRYHPAARATFHALTAAERRTSGTLREFAAWMGVED